MKKAGLVTALMTGALLCASLPAWAQFQRYDYIWARSTNGAALTLDGQLNEPQWAQAESLIITTRQDGPIPGSGWKDEGGFISSDPNRAVFRFLTVDNQLWLAVTVRDSSIGGSDQFNRFDGLLMSLKGHNDPGHPSPPREHFMSWWWPPESGDLNPKAINKPMSMVGYWRTWPPNSVPPTTQQLQAWDARYVVNGTVNSDTLMDQGYTVEMRFDLGLNGYDVTDADGDIIEWNCSLYDIDNFWPLANFFRFAVNRTWVQGPWGNAAWFHNVHVLGRPSVNVTSGPTPVFAADMTIPEAGSYATPAIDGSLSESVWSQAPSIRLTYDDNAQLAAYPGVGPYRSGQYQAPVNGNGGTAFIADPGDAFVKYFFKGDTLFLGFDVNDQVVQTHTLSDRWDGFVVAINDRATRGDDRNMKGHKMTFYVGAGGATKTADELTYLRDTLGVVRCKIALKPGTTVDTLGVDTDAGWTAEMAINLRQFGYPAGLGDHALYWSCDLMDGDSFSPVTDSYGTRRWFFREWENNDGACVAFMNPAQSLAGVGDGDGSPSAYALLGSYPNPVREGAIVRYTLPEASLVDLEVFDLQGRVVASRAVGLQGAGQREIRMPQFAPGAGVYLYRVNIRNSAGAKRATLSGKMMVLR
ncbi:MAG: T9SS type A sorting domain-containing protein [Candidatus Eisenbacteria bacterium]